MLKSERSASTPVRHTQSAAVPTDEGRLERFELNDHYFEIDWNEVDPPGEEDQPGIPHDEVMREIRALQKRPVRTR
jgi:hypothetical protein